MMKIILIALCSVFLAAASCEERSSEAGESNEDAQIQTLQQDGIFVAQDEGDDMPADEPMDPPPAEDEGDQPTEYDPE